MYDLSTYNRVARVAPFTGALWINGIPVINDLIAGTH